MNTHDYRVDFAMSYAGEDSHVVEEVAKRLQDLGFSVFYARDRAHLLVGHDAEAFLEKLFEYAEQVVAFISENYKRKAWPRFEWDVIQDRDPANRFIPVRLDQVRMVGLPNNVSHVTFDGSNYDEIVETCAKKLIVFEKGKGIRRESEFEQILRAIEEESTGALDRAYQLVVDRRARAPHTELPFPDFDGAPSYAVIHEEWCDYSTVRRLVARITVPCSLCQEELRFNLVHSSVHLFNRHKPDAVMVLAYKDDPYGFDLFGHFTAGKAILAPYGDWSRAEEGFVYNLPTDKFHPSVVIDPAYFAQPGKSETRDREIFAEIVRQQDAIPDTVADYSDRNEAVKHDVAGTYEISIDEVREIIHRGITEHWSMTDP